ncbi:MAG TPA: hypothetical protein VNX70_14840 [Bryobacteraceae bacterium]|nr:hypothetical protein [Bryobacteraceae bacterium]
MTNQSAGALQDAFRVFQLGSSMETEIHPFRIDRDVDEAFTRASRKSEAGGDGVISIVDQLDGIGGFLEDEPPGR